MVKVSLSAYSLSLPGELMYDRVYINTLKISVWLQAPMALAP